MGNGNAREKKEADSKWTQLLLLFWSNLLTTFYEEQSTYCGAAVNTFALCCGKPVMHVKSEAHVSAFHMVTYCMRVANLCVWAQRIKITWQMTFGSLHNVPLFRSLLSSKTSLNSVTILQHAGKYVVKFMHIWIPEIF